MWYLFESEWLNKPDGLWVSRVASGFVFNCVLLNVKKVYTLEKNNMDLIKVTQLKRNIIFQSYFWGSMLNVNLQGCNECNVFGLLGEVMGLV